ncbi:MAG: ribosomal protein S18-alanine N-acetyltransferase [Candidatus Aminicenantales bacterium]
MEEGDLPHVLKIEKLSFPTPWHESTFRGEIHNKLFSHPLVIVHRFKRQIIGYLIYWQVEDEVHINNIAIHPDYRRKGIAETVLSKLFTEVSKKGIKRITLEVRPSNHAALSLYRKLGFVVLGLKRNYYTTPREDALVLVKFLNLSRNYS